MLASVTAVQLFYLMHDAIGSLNMSPAQTAAVATIPLHVAYAGTS